VVYLRQEGRGIGLINKLPLQDGLDTVEANERFPADPAQLRNGGRDATGLGRTQIRCITN